MARVPAICPKCGTEFVEIVRPAPVHHQIRKVGFFGKVRPDQPHEAEVGENSATYEPSESEDREPGEELNEELGDEAEQEFEAEDEEE